LQYRTTHTSSGVNGPFPVWSLKLSEDNFEKEGCENCVTFHSGEVLHVGIVSCFCSANGKDQLSRIFTKGLRSLWTYFWRSLSQRKVETSTI